MTIIYAIIAFGVIAIGGLIFFGLNKLQDLHKQKDCICNFLAKISSWLEWKDFKELHSDFLLRRNEFWSIFAQYLSVLVLIIVLTVLLLERVVEADAALPIMAGLVSFGIGKGIKDAKTSNEVPYREGQR